MLLSDFFENVYRTRRLRGKSENTSRLYRISIRSFERTLGRAPTLEDLTNDNVSRHMQRVLDNGRSKATANKDRSQLLTIWRYASQQGHLDRWPDVQAEIEPTRVPQAWLAEDVHALFKAVDALDGHISTADRALWWRCLLMLCLDTGERIGALLASEWSWLERDWLLVPAEHRKGKRRDRRYLVSPGTLTKLLELRSQTGQGKIFPWPYNELYVWQKFAKILKAAGLPHGRRDKFHRLRRTCASVVHAAGLDATEALDHLQRRTTQAYLDPRFTKEDQPSKIITDWLRHPPSSEKENRNSA